MALKKHHFPPRSPSTPDTSPIETAPCPVVVVSPVVENAPPPVADAGVLLYHDRAGKAMSHGLTEGIDNFHTMTASARTVLPSE